jgi:hypothetical protein
MERLATTAWARPLGSGVRLDGGAGNDVMISVGGSTTYRAGQGDGADTNSEFNSAGDQDLIVYEAGIAYDQLWFTQSGNHLEISQIGTGDKVTVSNWFAGADYRVEKIQGG